MLPPSPEAIELTEAELEAITRPAIARAIKEAKQYRYDKIKEAIYWWGVSNPQAAARLELDELKRRYMAAAQEQIHPAYATDHGLKQILHALSLYFANDAGFEKLADATGRPYALRKGLLLIGTKGVGKSSMMRVWGQINQRQRFGVKSCQAVAAAYAKDGDEGLEIYGQRHSSGVCFDDLGVEPLTSKNWGNDVSSMATVLQARYDLFQAGQIPGCATHLTTNLTWADLQKYGDRVTDRMVEMFNIVTFDPATPSRRQ